MLNVQKKIGYSFKNIKLLETALTHSSFANENNTKKQGQSLIHNETLEFLGDAVLGFVIAEYLYINIPSAGEGDLSKKRAAIVCEKSLAQCAREIGLGQAMKIGKSIDADKGWDKPSILSDAMEAVFAAVYLDAGLGIAGEVILRCLSEIIKTAIEDNPVIDYKTYLQELLHNRKIIDIEYIVIKESGPDHNKVFTSQVKIKGKASGTGSGSTKKESEQNAAKQAIDIFEKGRLS